MDTNAGPKREPSADPADSARADADPAGSLSDDAARFLAAVQAELRDVRRELRLFAVARWTRATLALKESALGLLAGLVGLAALFTIAIVGALALARSLFHGLLALTESLWLAEALQGLLLLGLAFGAFALAHRNLGRAAVRRLEEAQAREQRRAAAAPPTPPHSNMSNPHTDPTRGAL